MPNWVFNTMVVKSSNKKQLDDFIKRHFKKDEENELQFDFNTIIAEPSTKETCPKEYICECDKEYLQDIKGGNWFNWYKWRCDKWGTKWNACDTDIVSEGEDEIEVWFNTAWDKPRGIIKALKKMYKDLSFSFRSVYE